MQCSRLPASLHLRRTIFVGDAHFQINVCPWDSLVSSIEISNITLKHCNLQKISNHVCFNSVRHMCSNIQLYVCSGEHTSLHITLYFDERERMLK